MTIFPKIQNFVINREVHNQTIHPLFFSEEHSGPSMYIMWTHTSNTNKQSWQPNHFVSCNVIDETKQSSEASSSGQPPLKKQKIFDYFKCESHRNEPHSTNSQSHEQTEDSAEMPNNSNPETAEKPDGKAADHQTKKEFHRPFTFELGDILNGTVPLSSLSEMEKVTYVECKSSPDPETLKNLPFKTKPGAGKSKGKKTVFSDKLAREA